MKISERGIFYLKSLIHFSALATFIWLAYIVDQDLLGADPVKEMIHFLGSSKTSRKYELTLMCIFLPMAEMI